MARFLKKIMQQSRLEYYDSIIDLAVQNNYKITSLKDWFENYQESAQKILILRHDVDHDPQGARKMYETEKKHGVKSTFYFRWSTIKKNLLKQLIADGFEVSLHYETLATYSKRKKITYKSQISEKVIETCRRILKNEIQSFIKSYGPISSVCSHGDLRNRILETPNTAILKNENRKDYNIEFESYDEIIINNIDIYISDSSIVNEHEWKGEISPEEAIKKQYKTICILTHPVHWNYNLIKTLQVLLRQVLEDKFNLILKSY